MVLLTGDGKGSGECRGPTAGKLLQLPPSSEPGAQPGGPGVAPKGDLAALDESAGGDGAGTGGDDDYEEFEDFSVLPETHSIASDDSFYPPLSDDDDEGDDWSLGESDPSDSPEPPLTLFRACRTNNVLVLRALIRQGLEEEAVRETDRNKRVRGKRLAHHAGWAGWAWGAGGGKNGTGRRLRVSRGAPCSDSQSLLRLQSSSNRRVHLQSQMAWPSSFHAAVVMRALASRRVHTRGR